MAKADTLPELQAALHAAHPGDIYIEAPSELWLEVLRQEPTLLEVIVHQQRLPADMLRVLAVNPDPRIRSLVASKRRLPPDVMEILSQDDTDWVRGSLGHNRAAPTGLLQRLLNDPVRVVRQHAADTLRARGTEVEYEVAVSLLDEGTECWKVIKAVGLGAGKYRLLGPDYDAEDERWEFPPGSIVEVDLRILSDGPCLVAVRLTAEP